MTEDPELAQARVLVRELRSHADMLTRELQYVTRPEAQARKRADLRAVQNQLDRLRRHYPALATPPEILAG